MRIITLRIDFHRASFDTSGGWRWKAACDAVQAGEEAAASDAVGQANERSPVSTASFRADPDRRPD